MAAILGYCLSAVPYLPPGLRTGPPPGAAEVVSLASNPYFAVRPSADKLVEDLEAVMLRQQRCRPLLAAAAARACEVGMDALAAAGGGPVGRWRCLRTACCALGRCVVEKVYWQSFS